MFDANRFEIRSHANGDLTDGASPDLVATFTNRLHGLGYSDRTIRVYRSQVERWLAWCAVEGVEPMRPSQYDLADYADLLPHSHASRRQYRTVMKHWFDAHTIQDHPPLTSIRVPKKKRYHCRALDPGQARRLAHVALDVGHPRGSVVLIGLFLGLRRTEIATMDWRRFDLAMEWYTVFGKGSVEATIPVHQTIKNLLEDYMSVYPYVFPGANTNHVHSATVGDWVEIVGVAAGIDGLQAHVLRHTAISALNDATGDLPSSTGVRAACLS